MTTTSKMLFIDDLSEKGLVGSHYGGMVACCSRPGEVMFLPLYVDPGVPFHSSLLLMKGEMELTYAQETVMVTAHDLLQIPPYAKIEAITPNDTCEMIYLLLDTTYADSIGWPETENPSGKEKARSQGMFPTIYHIDEMKVLEMAGIVKQIESAIINPHFYMKEIMRSLIYVSKAFIIELDSFEEIIPHDFSHKENVFKIFLHLATTHFREHRLIDYYADRLCITNTYLSRIVREVSGKTVNNHLTQLLYDEACRLLSTTDIPLGQLAYDLHFSDQSAFSNFFKMKSSMTPKAFRAKYSKV